jgi:uncharacterized protein YbjT (DUF2867 family)
MKKITVFGATGMLGKPVVGELANAGFEVTAMARDANAARRALPSEVKIVAGDLQNRADIERALAGAEAVYLNLSVKPKTTEKDFQPERDGLKNILEAAKKSGVRRVAYCSSLVHRYQGMNGFHWWTFDIKKQAVEMIKQSGVPYTIFYPSSFMENFDKGGYKQGNKMQLAGESKFPMWFIAGADYGKQVARAFQTLESADRDYDVQGLQAFTADEAVKIFVENYRKEKLKISKAPMFVLKLAGLFSREIGNTAKIIEALNNYPEKFNAETTWAELGKPSVTLAEYARNC